MIGYGRSAQAGRRLPARLAQDLEFSAIWTSAQRARARFFRLWLSRLSGAGAGNRVEAPKENQFAGRHGDGEDVLA
jgi:hypothetical protein